ncbi:hypothetical protein KEM56_004940, partial [Ascosphaera pollenicola]
MQMPSSPPADVQQPELQQHAVPITTAHPQNGDDDDDDNNNNSITNDKDSQEKTSGNPNYNRVHDSNGNHAADSNAIPASGYLEPHDRSTHLLRKPQSVPSLALSKKQGSPSPDNPNDGSTLSPPPRPASADSAHHQLPQRGPGDGIHGLPDGQNVQFAPGTLQPPNHYPSSAGHSRSSSFNHTDADDQNKDSRLPTSLFSKLKAFAANTSFPTHSRSFSASAAEGGPAESRMAPMNASVLDEEEEYDDSPNLRDEDTDADADAESDSEGPQETRVKRKRRLRRPGADSGGQSAPSLFIEILNRYVYYFDQQNET